MRAGTAILERRNSKAERRFVSGSETDSLGSRIAAAPRLDMPVFQTSEANRLNVWSTIRECRTRELQFVSFPSSALNNMKHGVLCSALLSFPSHKCDETSLK